jgi:hypothetical protein
MPLACWTASSNSCRDACVCFVRQVGVSATDPSLVQRIPSECGVPEWDRESSIMRGLWPNTGCCEKEGGDGLVVADNKSW